MVLFTYNCLYFMVELSALNCTVIVCLFCRLFVNTVATYFPVGKMTAPEVSAGRRTYLRHPVSCGCPRSHVGLVKMGLYAG
ncbi:hypothetical protein FKM82_021215 [Ascaphus truei]